MSVHPEGLLAFVRAAELGSFSAAARALGKRQSTISETLANLEIDLGLALFERQGRQPTLTAAGQQLLGWARQLLLARDGLLHQAQLLAAGVEPRLTLVLSDTFHSGDFEAVLSVFARRFPSVELECLVGEQHDVLALVQSGRAQLGLLTALPDYPADLARTRLPLPAHSALFVARSHPLASQVTLTEQDLSAHRQLRLQTCQAPAHPEPGRQPCWSAPSYLLLLEMAQHGFGWAELPHWLVERYGRDLVALRLPGWPRRQPIDTVWSRQRPLGQAAAWVLAWLNGQLAQEDAPAGTME